MSWSLEQAKIYLGIDPADDTQDAAVTQVMDVTLKSIETMLARELLRARTTVRFLNTTCSGVIQLPQAPITEVFDVDGGGVPDDLLIHHDIGTITHWSLANQRTLDVDFEGGFDPLPADLERVMWEAFMLLWNQTDQTTGGPPADGGATPVSSGEIKDLTVFDAFKVSYNTSGSSGGDDGGAASDDFNWGWLAPWAPTLASYRWGPAGAELGMA